MKFTGNQKGFTLLEVLIAVFLLAVGLMSLTSMQTTAISGNKFAKDSSVAIKLAEEFIERIRANSGYTPEIYDHIDSSRGCIGLSDPAFGDCEQWRVRLKDRNLGLVNAVGRVEVDIDTPTNRAAFVTVTIQWGSKWGVKTRTVTLSTIIETWVT